MTHQFSADTTASEVASVYSDRIKGRTVLVTGVSPKGLGSQTVLTLAQAGAGLVILASRSPDKVEEVISSVKKQVPDANLRFLELDLASLESVRKAGKAVIDYKEPLHIVINNAALVGPYRKTKDGFESQFGANHLGHFVFTNTIIPKLIKTAKADSTYKPRIVNVSSLAHTFTPVLFEDVGFKNGETYDKWIAYGQSKTANVLYTVSLAERLAKHGILAYSLHPGTIHTTITRDFTTEDLNLMGMVDEHGKPKETIENAFGTFKVKNLEQGAATHIFAAFSSEIEDQSGAYLDDSQVAEAKEYATNKDNADRLWSLSEQLAGEKYAF